MNNAEYRPETTSGFDYFWEYASYRQGLYWERIKQEPVQLKNPTILDHRFTNVYRAADRVSQYLINRIQDDQRWSFEETFIRTLVFKFFNKIETWEFLTNKGVEVNRVSLFNNEIETALTDLWRQKPLYNPAYILPPPVQFNGPKFKRHLKLIKLMVDDKLPSKIENSEGLESAFEKLKTYQSIGNFLAYQFLIDLNYSSHLSFNENEFVVPGPGAMRGLRKCFIGANRSNASALIKWTTTRQDAEFKQRGLPWKNLYGRRLHLIDVQNIFCEVDKYTRVVHPNLSAKVKDSRIKQYYRPNPKPLSSRFPEKWNLAQNN